MKPIVFTLLASIVLMPGIGALAGQGGRADGEQLTTQASAFARSFFDDLANVVAEERYVQQTTAPRRQRVLRSEFYMVRYPGAAGWLAFRDVFEVDGKPVGRPDSRLLQLFADPPRDVLARAGEIAREGARHNLRDIGTVNNPLFAMAMLQPAYSGRFRFTAAGLDRDVGPDVHVLHFEEWRRPSLLRGASNTDLLTSGRIWIDETTGRVLQTELEVGQRFPVRIETLFAFDEGLGIHVPREMRDWYPDGAGEIRGVATYASFRRFRVQTSEAVGNPRQ
jgi:hypothetical protein